MSSIRLIKDDNDASITVKGSKFHSYLYRVNTKEDVDSILNAMKKEHYKASHICYAYRIGKEEFTEYSTDAGEPSGTAGKPILGVIQKFDVTEIMLAVVRYFGGTKLGIRGLIDAYHDASEIVMKSSSFITMSEYKLLRIFIKYTNLSSVEYKVRDKDGLWFNIDYKNSGALVTIGFKIEDYDKLKDWIGEMIGTKQIEIKEKLGRKWINVNEY